MATIKVMAADGVEVPLEDGRVLKVEHGVVELEATIYNRRRVMDGDLIKVVDNDVPVAPALVAKKTKGA